MSQSVPDDLGLTQMERPKLTPKISITNSTTNTRTPKDATVLLVELGTSGFVLEIPRRSCAAGHNLLIEVETPDDREKFTVTAKVEELEAVQDTAVDRVRLSFMQFDEIVWRRFCQKFETRQAEIENFLKAARGF